MPVKIRLTRHGHKKSPFYHVVIADSRAPRDGRYIERIGNYNPCTNPATIELDFDKALDWLQKGAQPTDTCRSILSQQGVLLKNHLLEGVKKGAFSEEEAEKRFQAWLKEKESRIKADKDKIAKKKAAEKVKSQEALERKLKKKEREVEKEAELKRQYSKSLRSVRKHAKEDKELLVVSPDGKSVHKPKCIAVRNIQTILNYHRGQ